MATVAPTNVLSEALYKAIRTSIVPDPALLYIVIEVRTPLEAGVNEV
jgi:hypothetical protein